MFVLFLTSMISGKQWLLLVQRDANQRMVDPQFSLEAFRSGLDVPVTSSSYVSLSYQSSGLYRYRAY